ncbi:MAG TPA: 23S rRNA (pseudouridine(1915)-N(3))-methyltransferase RlmH [Gemmatimonadales bacterium]|nr:23S rRNA (pseudouridine(1915)-N(3))-methyltransferase RlmH [Gemmatimonadales bacterium]
MRITLVAVGALRGPGFRAACDEYLTRLRRYGEVTEREVKEAGRIKDVASRQAVEAERLQEALPDGATIVALAREGTGWSSRDLAGRIERWRLEARPVAFLIGGSTGLAAPLLARASARWSLGPLTLPHELARIVVLEQLYRGWTILRGEPYHKGR